MTTIFIPPDVATTPCRRTSHHRPAGVQPEAPVNARMSVWVDAPPMPTASDGARPPKTYFRRARVEARTGLPTSTMYRYMKLGLFPRPHRLGPNTVGWSADDVEAWCASRAQA